MPKVTPEKFVEKWKNNLGAASSYIRDGVNSVKESPTHQAALAEDRWFTNLTAAKNAGKWKAGLESVSLDYWKDRMSTVGISRIQEGVTKADTVMQDFASKLLEKVGTLQKTIEAMPNKTIEDSVQRASTWIREMNKWSYTKPKR